MPAHFCQSTLFLFIALLVPANFRHPEIMIRCWYLAAGRTLHSGRIHKMPMPEASVDEDASPVFPQNQVRMPRQPLMIQSVSKTTFPQPTSHNHLWLRILRANARHIFVYFFRRTPTHITDVAYMLRSVGPRSLVLVQISLVM